MNGHCLDLFAFLLAFDTAFDIATSLIIIALPVIIVSPLQMSTGKKIQEITAFAFRILPCAVAVICLVYLQRALASENQTWEAVHWQMWTQVSLHFSIVTAAMPCLKMFLEGNVRQLHLTTTLLADQSHMQITNPSFFIRTYEAQLELKRNSCPLPKVEAAREEQMRQMGRYNHNQ